MEFSRFTRALLLFFPFNGTIIKSSNKGGVDMGVKVTLKALRANNNMTQPQLAEKLGVSVSTVQSWENKGVQPRADQIAKLLNLFHVNFDDVIFF